MARLTPDEAIALARVRDGFMAGGARAWRVTQLDRPGEAYYLVVVGDESASVAVAALDADTGEWKTSARLPGCGPHLTVDEGQARRLAGVDDEALAELVWKPCRISLSPLYPFWQIATTQGTCYVDQAGQVWERLVPAGPGG